MWTGFGISLCIAVVEAIFHPFWEMFQWKIRAWGSHQKGLGSHQHDFVAFYGFITISMCNSKQYSTAAKCPYLVEFCTWFILARMCFSSQFWFDRHGINIQPTKIMVAVFKPQGLEVKHSRKCRVGSNRKVIKMDKTLAAFIVPCF